jgi:hypothetical protein
MNITRSYKSVEARSVAALRLKVLSKQAMGWSTDGPVLHVTGYRNGKRGITKYSQGMVKPEMPAFRWATPGEV